MILLFYLSIAGCMRDSIYLLISLEDQCKKVSKVPQIRYYSALNNFCQKEQYPTLCQVIITCFIWWPPKSFKWNEFQYLPTIYVRLSNKREKLFGEAGNLGINTLGKWVVLYWVEYGRDGSRYGHITCTRGHGKLRLSR